MAARVQNAGRYTLSVPEERGSGDELSRASDAGRPQDVTFDVHWCVVHILVADDAPNVRKLLRLILEPAHRIIEAVDGDDALRQLAAHRPDMVILDVAMPGRTGLEVCRRLRSDPDAALASTGVIVITANGVQTDRSMALAAGADRFLTKPFSPAGIVRAVEEVVAARQATTARQSMSPATNVDR